VAPDKPSQLNVKIIAKKGKAIARVFWAELLFVDFMVSDSLFV
jgi:hypothetical protein